MPKHDKATKSSCIFTTMCMSASQLATQTIIEWKDYQEDPNNLNNEMTLDHVYKHFPTQSVSPRIWLMWFLDEKQMAQRLFHRFNLIFN